MARECPKCGSSNDDSTEKCVICAVDRTVGHQSAISMPPRKKVPRAIIWILLCSALSFLFSLVVHQANQPDQDHASTSADDSRPINLRYIGASEIACSSESDFDKAVKFMVGKDFYAVGRLVDSGDCFHLKIGAPVYLEDSTFSGKVKIRPQGSTESVWTFRETLTDKPPEGHSSEITNKEQSTPSPMTSRDESGQSPNDQTSSAMRELTAVLFEQYTKDNPHPTRATVAGDGNTILVLLNSSYNAIFADALMHTHEWIEPFDAAGFKTIIFKDGKGHSWRVNMDKRYNIEAQNEGAHAAHVPHRQSPAKSTSMRSPKSAKSTDSNVHAGNPAQPHPYPTFILNR